VFFFLSDSKRIYSRTTYVPKTIDDITEVELKHGMNSEIHLMHAEGNSCAA